MKGQIPAYRQRAERAMCRKLSRHEHVHHHSETQLVICSAAYHRWLHQRMRQRGIPNPKLSNTGLTRHNFHLPDRQHQEVSDIAKTRGATIAQVIRAAIDRYLESHQ